MKIIIIGCGISGLTTAYELSKNKDISIEMYDTSDTYNKSVSYNSPANIICTNMIKPDISNLLSNNLHDLHQHMSLIFEYWLSYKQVNNNIDYYKYIQKFVQEQSNKDSGIYLSNNIHLFQNKKIFNQFISVNNKNEYRILNKSELNKYHQNINYGISFHKSGKMNSNLLIKYLIDICISRNIKIHYNTSITKIIQNNNNNSVNYLLTSDNTKIYGDKFILCTGSNTKFLLNTININIPLYNIFSYKVYTDKPIFNKDTVVLYDNDHYFINTINNKTQISSGLFINKNERNQQKFINDIENKFGNIDYNSIWCKNKDLTLDRFSIIDKINNNLYINCGNGFRGMTNSFGNANILYDIIINNTKSILPHNRFKLNDNHIIYILIVITILYIVIFNSNKKILL